ncbi:MAG: peptidoglycan DD-metalloendopeptidase family protein, partial [Oscillospiraceae bacterium]|nr:peptidoglycan DD-metalloendopeptidase family protein [Oscillospiraceae bacterium]
QTALPGYQYLDSNGRVLNTEYTLYEVENFDVLTATNMQARLRDNKSGILAVFSPLFEFFETAYEQVVKFFEKIDEVFSQEDTGLYMPYSDRAHPVDIVDSVYHSLSFSNQAWFSDARSSANNAAGDGLIFVFVGKNAQFSTGTSFHSAGTLIPGISTSVNGVISPTDNYYQPLTSYSPNTGMMEIGTPRGSNVLAVASGKIIDVGTTTADVAGRYIVLEVILDGHIYHIKYGNLDTIHVSIGDTVSQKDILATSGINASGKETLYLSVKKDRTTIDPSSIFYQSTYSIGVSMRTDLYNQDGSVNEASIERLEEELTAYVNSGGGTYHNKPINTLSYLQCTWWVRGRGLQYLEHTGALGNTITVQQYIDSCRGNGGDYYANNRAAGGFAYGTEPRPNALVCYQGNPGHVAYVEAVDYVNRVYYISHAGGGTQWLGIQKKSFRAAASGSGGQYAPGVFIYLDQCNY